MARKQTALSVVLVSVLALSVPACNMWGNVDSAKSDTDLFETGQTKIENNECADAVSDLSSISHKDDEMWNALGWAQLCTAGATFAKIGKAFLTYDRTQNNLSLLVGVANGVFPQTAASILKIEQAIVSFNQISNARTKAFNVATANLVKASALLAKAALGSNVMRSDVSGASCLGDCTIVFGNCTGSRMSDSDAADFGAAFDGAQAAVTGLSGFGALKDLADRVGADVSGGTANANATRCYIFNSILSR